MSVQRIRWGVLSTANIGMKKVLPGMQRGQFSQVAAIASRDLPNARQAAAQLGIERAYGSYEELLADPDIDAIYNPLPNDLHVPWTIKAAEVGKHVLCEKPIGLSVAETRELIAVRDRLATADRPVKIGEAFMVALHPQWLRVRELVASGRIGELRLVQGDFSYFNVQAENIRNSLTSGGGALMDIGCYLVFFARLVFGAEPTRVISMIDRDRNFGTDRLSSFLLQFPNGQCIGSCSTQLVPHQRVEILGSKGRIAVEIPVNTPLDRAVRLLIDDGLDLFGGGSQAESFGPLDQYTLQGDAFSRAILDNTEVPVPLESAARNMAVLEALFRSAKSNGWETP